MSARPIPLLLTAVLAAAQVPVVPAAGATPPDRCEPCQCHRRDRALQEARSEAEMDTGGEAVAARWVRLPNTLSSDPLGVEVLVHMAGRDRGYRCLVDVVKMKVVRKDSAPNPASRVR